MLELSADSLEATFCDPRAADDVLAEGVTALDTRLDVLGRFAEVGESARTGGLVAELALDPRESTIQAPTDKEGTISPRKDFHHHRSSSSPCATLASRGGLPDAPELVGSEQEALEV